MMVHSVFVDSSCQQYADEQMLKRASPEVREGDCPCLAFFCQPVFYPSLVLADCLVDKENMN